MLPSAVWLRSLLGVVVTLSLLSCRSSSVEESAAPLPAPEAGASFDVSAVMRQVHFAWRPEGSGWRGGHSTYDARASADGLTLTPFFHPRVDASGVEGAPLTLGAVQVRRGLRETRATEARVRVEKGGHLFLSREGFTEHLRNAEDGVQQEWVFEAAPVGTGDLVLNLPVRGLAFAEGSEQGLHFRDAKSGLGFRYGHAAWVDATGRSTPLQARYRAGAIQFQVPEALLEATLFPATLAPTISPEIGTNQPVPEPQIYSQQAPSVASNGSGQLVVWEDFRGLAFEIFGARVSSAGVVLDDWGLHISRESEFPSSPSVASNGTDYLVVWEDTLSGSEASIRGTRVSGAGEVHDVTGLALGTSTSGQHAPDVASNGTDYLVVWWDMRNGNPDIYGTRVASTGEVVDGAGLAIARAAQAQSLPSVASNGTDYFVVWEDARAGNPDVFGTRVTSAGAVLEDSGLAIASESHSQVTPSVASNGTDYLVAWEDARLESAGDIFGARVTSAGVVLDASAFAISTESQSQETPSVASNGTDYLIVWEDARLNDAGDIFGARVTSTGAVVDASGFAISTIYNGQTRPSVAFNGTDFYVAWQDARSSLDIYGARVTTTGEVLDSSGVVLSTAANGQSFPEVASNGTDYLVVWSGHRQQDNSAAIFGVRVSGSGEVLDASGLEISPAGNHLFHKVASNGTDYLVVWEDVTEIESRVMGARITGGGVILDAQGLVLSAPTVRSSSAPSVASNGTDYLVVWNTRPGETSLSTISGTRVTSAGAVLDASRLTISGPPALVDAPAVASNGTDYLVVWQDYRNDNSDIYGARVTSAGAVLEASGFVITTAVDTQRDPAVASNGTDYFVAWGDFRRSSASDVYGARVSREGAVLDPSGVAISTAARYQQFPSVASLGAEYVVVWQDHSVSTPNPNIYGARVTNAGAVRAPMGFVIADTADTEEAPSVAFAGSGRTAFVVYDRFDLSAPYWNHRVRGRFMTFNDNQPPSAVSQAVGAVEDTPLEILLQGSDPEGQALTYDIVTLPQHGVLSGTGARRTYAPAARYSGPDSFTFRVSDGEFVSAVVRVSIQVTPFNDAPSIPVLVSPAQGARLESGLVAFQWNASTDEEGEALTYQLEVLQGGEAVRTHSTMTTTWALAASEALPPGSYAWRVKATDARDAASAFSAERTFTVAEVPLPTDGGVPDAGAPDAGEPDAGTGVDGGVADAGTGTDGGTVPPPDDSDTSGCGCNPIPGAGPGAPLTLTALGLLLRSSRRRR
ncbi:Ig-like domain-containing protein [Pyxidicoccus caerfyrddinensis]|uniref:Ig-like domain-containing protein n=1 Tax=Pyxidicoccus caerfyrddinensis TaxID=2709663 RepID=UPI0013DCAC87|nr:Ig-like domain-containing protein [Pyxidicoccus caerfyrddinensis]